jgi:predicted ATP-dependent endonuclease of OLD family
MIFIRFSIFAIKKAHYMSEEQDSYIQQVHLKGYKSVKDLTVSFQKGLNIIIGANGSGKTNFMEFLDAAYGSNYERLLNNRKFEVEILSNSYKAQIESDINNTTLNRKKHKFKITEKIQNKGDISYNFTKSYFYNEDKKIENIESFNFNGNPNEIPFTEFDNNEILYLSFDNPINQILKEKLKFTLFIWLNFNVDENGDTEIAQMVRGNLLAENFKTFLNRVFDIVSFLSDDITLEKIILEFKQNEWLKLDSLRENLSKSSPIKNVKIDWSLSRHYKKGREEDEDEGERAIIEGIDFQFYVNNEWINWTQLSDGTKRLFYLIGSVTYAKENEIILMEEPELGVHPHQLTLLMNFLKAESETKQIIISTHSPQVLNCLKEDELDHIIVARHEGKAGTQMYHLSEEEKGFAAEYMKNQAFLSDYWLQSGFMNDETIEPI